MWQKISALERVIDLRSSVGAPQIGLGAEDRASANDHSAAALLSRLFHQAGELYRGPGTLSFAGLLRGKARR